MKGNLLLQNRELEACWRLNSVITRLSQAVEKQGAEVWV